jgi:hypothetical protein
MEILGTMEGLHGSCRERGGDEQKRPGPTIQHPHSLLTAVSRVICPGAVSLKRNIFFGSVSGFSF